MFLVYQAMSPLDVSGSHVQQQQQPGLTNGGGGGGGGGGHVSPCKAELPTASSPTKEKSDAEQAAEDHESAHKKVGTSPCTLDLALVNDIVFNHY